MPPTSPEDQAKEVQDYFETVFNGYLVSDIKTLLNPQLDGLPQGGCSVQLAMTVLSAMNQLGYLTSNKETKEITKVQKTETCIKEFCQIWMKDIGIQNYRKSTVQELLIEIFRHPVAHQFLPYQNAALTRDPVCKNLITITKRDWGKVYVLQVKILAIDFLAAIDLLNIKMTTALNNDTGFISRFYERLLAQREKYYAKNESLFEKAVRNPPGETLNNNVITTGTNVSGSLNDELISGELRHPKITEDCGFFNKYKKEE